MGFREVGWVLDHSPYTLATRLVHIVLAERANEDHDWELWYSLPTVAKKAKVSRRTVESALAQMCRDGLVTMLAEPPGKPRRYRFLMPETPANSAYPPPAILDTEPTQSTDSDLLIAEVDKNARAPQETDPFDEFYAVYPLHKAPDAARRAFARALKRASFEEIMNGARCYRDDPTRKPDFTKHPATWLNAGCWQDYAEDPAGHAEALPPGGIRPFPPAEVGPDFSVDADARRAQRERLAALKAAR